QQVEECERHAHEGEDLEVPRHADLQLAMRDADDPDRAGEIAAPVLREQGGDSRAGVAHDVPQVRCRPAGGLAGRVADELHGGLEAEDPAALTEDRRAWT